MQCCTRFNKTNKTLDFKNSMFVVLFIVLLWNYHNKFDVWKSTGDKYNGLYRCPWNYPDAVICLNNINHHTPSVHHGDGTKPLFIPAIRVADRINSFPVWLWLLSCFSAILFATNHLFKRQFLSGARDASAAGSGPGATDLREGGPSAPVRAVVYDRDGWLLRSFLKYGGSYRVIVLDFWNGCFPKDYIITN